MWPGIFPSHKWLGYFQKIILVSGRGFVVRDLPWTVEKLRIIPPFEFENWAVIALGGIPIRPNPGESGQLIRL